MRSASFGSILRQLFFVVLAAVLVIIGTNVVPDNMSPSFGFGVASTATKLPLLGKAAGNAVAHSFPRSTDVKPRAAVREEEMRKASDACSSVTHNHQGRWVLERIPQLHRPTSVVTKSDVSASTVIPASKPPQPASRAQIVVEEEDHSGVTQGKGAPEDMNASTPPNIVTAAPEATPVPKVPIDFPVRAPHVVMQGPDVARMAYLSSLVPPSTGEEGRLLSPISLDYENEHILYTRKNNSSPDPTAHGRVVFFETELVQLDHDTTTTNSQHECSLPRAVIADDNAFSRALQQIIDSGSLRSHTQQQQTDGWIIVVPCFNSAFSSCGSYSMDLELLENQGPKQLVLHPLHSSLVAIGGGGGSRGAKAQKIMSLLQEHPIFILPVLTSELAYKTQQTLYRAAASVLSLFHVVPPQKHEAAELTTHVAVIQLDEVILCEDVFQYFVDHSVASPTIYAVAFRNATETQRTLGCCWFAQSFMYALGSGENLPGELVGQPVTTHYFIGSNSLTLMRALLKSVFFNQNHRDGDSPNPHLTRSLVLDFRAHVSLLNSPIPYENRRAALITDANETVCQNHNGDGDDFSNMCRIQHKRKPTQEATSPSRRSYTMIVEAQNCHILPVPLEKGAVGQKYSSSTPFDIEVRRSSTTSQFSCVMPPVVAADVVVVNITRTDALVDELSPLFPNRQKSLKEFLLSASGHYGIKGNTGSIEKRGRGIQSQLDLGKKRSDSNIEEPRCRGKDGWQDVIIAYAAGYSSRKNVAPLLNTFRKYHTEGCTKLYLFVLAEHVEAFSHEGPDVIPVSVSKYRDGLLRTAKCKLLKTRKEIIYLWLKENLISQIKTASSGTAIRPFRYAMMIDSRDLFFQADPFESIARIDAALRQSSTSSSSNANSRDDEGSGFMLFPPEVAWFGEMEWTFRGGFAFNMRWVLEAFGYSFTHRMFREVLPVTKCLNLHNKSRSDDAAAFPCTSLPIPIICGGIYAGTAMAMLDFLKLLVNAMSARPAKQQDCHNDQGMMNGLLGGGGFALAGFPHQILLSNPYSTWATHRPRRGTVRWAFEEGEDDIKNNAKNVTRPLPQLQNCHGEPYAVVHQLDRFPAIWQQFLDTHK